MIIPESQPETLEEASSVLGTYPNNEVALDRNAMLSAQIDLNQLAILSQRAWNERVIVEQGPYRSMGLRWSAIVFSVQKETV